MLQPPPIIVLLHSSTGKGLKMKLITFAVPCYNSEAYMDHCIESLLITGDVAEILIIDDGSTKDNTAQKADEYE